MTDTTPDPYVLETFTPHVEKEFSVLHPQVPADFKLRLVQAYDATRGSWPKKFRRPLGLNFRGPSDVLLIEGDYEIETEGFASMCLHISPIVTHDREENGQMYQGLLN
jgi:hypothetical protein